MLSLLESREKPYTAGSKYAIDITQSSPIKIKALLRFSSCNSSVSFEFNQFNSIYGIYPVEVINYGFTSSACGTGANALDAYASVLEEVPISATSCTDPDCDNYGEIRFTLNLPTSYTTYTYDTIYVHTGGQLTSMASGANLRCECIKNSVKIPIKCQANQDSKDFKISMTINTMNVDHEFVITTDAAKPGFLIPAGTATPIKVEVSVYKTGTLYYYNTIDYYPPHKLLENFSINFLHRISDNPNYMIISLKYTGATANDIFYLGISTETVTMNNLGMEDSTNFSNGEPLPCVFDSCSACACYAVDSSDSRVIPFKVKVVGLDISTDKTFRLLGLYFRPFMKNQKYTFTGELWSSAGIKIAESKFENTFYPADKKYSTSNIYALQLNTDSISDTDSTFYDFKIIFTGPIYQERCFIRFTKFPGMLSSLSSKVDPSTAEVAASSKEVWILPYSGPGGNEYIPFSMKAPSIQFGASQMLEGSLYCFTPYSYTSVFFAILHNLQSNTSNPFNLISSNSFQVTSAFTVFAKDITNIITVSLSFAEELRQVMAIKITFSAGEVDYVFDYYEVIVANVSSLPYYTAQLEPGKKNKLIIIFSESITIPTSIQVTLSFKPTSDFTTTFELFGDADLAGLKFSGTSSSSSVTTVTPSPVIITHDNLPGQSTSDFSFTIYYLTQISSQSSIAFRFSDPRYRLVDDLSSLSLSIACYNGFQCNNVNIQADSISLDANPNNPDYFYAYFYTSTSTTIKVSGVITLNITTNGTTYYYAYRYSNVITSSRSNYGSQVCRRIHRYYLNLKQELRTGDTIRFMDISNRQYSDTGFYMMSYIKSTETELSFTCSMLNFSPTLSYTAIDCRYNGQTTVSTEILLFFHHIPTAADHYLIISVFRRVNGMTTLYYYKDTRDDPFAPCSSNNPTLVNGASGSISTRFTGNYQLGELYKDNDFIILDHGGKINNISLGSEFGALNTDSNRTYFYSTSSTRTNRNLQISFDFLQTSTSQSPITLNIYCLHDTLKVYTASYAVDGAALSGYTLTKQGFTGLTIYRNECFSLNLRFSFTIGKTDEVRFNISAASFSYINDAKIFTVSSSIETPATGFKTRNYMGNLSVLGSYLNNTTYIIKNIRYCLASTANMVLSTYYNGVYRTNQNILLTADSTTSSLMTYGFNAFKGFSVVTPYRPPKTNAVNSIYFSARLPSMSSTYSNMRGKIRISILSGATLSDDRYYMSFYKTDKVTNSTSFGCYKVPSSYIECYPPYTSTSSETWGNGNFLIRVGSPTMSKAGFSELSSTIQLKIQLSTTSLPTSASPTYDYESNLEYIYNTIPSAKFEHIYRPESTERLAFGNVLMRAPKDITVGSQLMIEFPVCDDIYLGDYMGDFGMPLPNSYTSNACTVYSSTRIDVSCKYVYGEYLADRLACLRLQPF